MGPKHHENNGCLPTFGNNFLTLFGLMVLDDEERKRRAEMLEEEDQEEISLDLDEDIDDNLDDHTYNDIEDGDG